MNGKKIRTYTLNYWLKSFIKKAIWMVLFSTYLIMAFYCIDSLLGEGKAMSFFRDILVLGESEKNVLLNEVLILGSQWGYYISAILGVTYMLNYRSMVMLPLSMGSTRREAYVGYELAIVITMFLANLHSLILAFISKEIAGESVLFSHYPVYIAILISFIGVAKLLFSIQFENSSKTGNLVKVILGCYIFGAAIGIFVHHLFMVAGENEMKDGEWINVLVDFFGVEIKYGEWLYALVAVLGVLTWVIGGKITLKKSKNIEVLMLFT